MRKRSLVVLVLAILAIAPKAFAQGDDTGLAPGKNLPGPFHPFNVTGKRKANFHCLVSQQGLDPCVIVFTKDLEFGDPLKDLLKKLDDAIEKNPNERMLAFVVFLPTEDQLKDVVIDDDNREAIVMKIEGLQQALDLKHVLLTVTTPKYVEKYKLDPAVNTTVVLYHKFTVMAAHTTGMLTAEQVTAIRKDVADKLGAKRE